MRTRLLCLTFLSHVWSLAINKQSDVLTVHESVNEIPSAWTYHSDIPEEQILTLRTYLSQPHADVARIAGDVSDPTSARYGRYLTADELVLALPDTTNASTAVSSWLRSHAINDISSGPDWLDFTTTVGHARELLGAKFGAYRYLDEEPVARTTKYSLPEGIRDHVDFIYPTIHFLLPKRGAPLSIEKRQHIPTGPANCSNSVCPNQLKDKYHISYRPKDNKSDSQIAIAGFLENFPNITDVNSFLSKYGLVKNAKPPSYNIVSINNGTKKAPADGGALTVEAELDLDYSVAFTGPLDVTFYSVGGRGAKLSQPGKTNLSPRLTTNRTWRCFNMSLRRRIHHKSFRYPTATMSRAFPWHTPAASVIFSRRLLPVVSPSLALPGMEVLQDQEATLVSGLQTHLLEHNNTNVPPVCRGPDGKRRFIPTFPSSCPWITSVGATAGFGGAASFSSGGMSNYFARPAYQAQNVSAYIKELNGKHKGLYNTTGRGIPDVSLLGDDYLTLTGGFPSTHDGTSASAPVFAAMIALINDVRLRNKKPALGFLNPMLYAAKAQSVYRDVADGSDSIGCADGNYFESGWEALKGWDAATGLGEPDFEKLRVLLA